MIYVMNLSEKPTIDPLMVTKHAKMLSNGLIMEATYNDFLKTFHINLRSGTDAYLPNVYLDGKLYGNSPYSSFKLEAIENTNSLTKRTGIATLMFRLLLTFIADLNSNPNTEASIDEIIGSIQAYPGQEESVKTFYRNLSGISDFNDRIIAIIDDDKCTNNDLYYKINYKKN